MTQTVRPINWITDTGLYPILPVLVSDPDVQQALTQATQQLENNRDLSALGVRRRLKYDYLREKDPELRLEKRALFETYDQQLTGDLRVLADIEDNSGLYFNYQGDILDLNNDMTKAYWGLIELTPENFEQYSQSFPQYSKILTTLENARYRFDPNIPREEQMPPKFPADGSRQQMDEYQRARVEYREAYPWIQSGSFNIRKGEWHIHGWNSRDLKAAIENSGLDVERRRPLRRGNVVITRGIPLSALNIRSRLSPGLEDQIYLPGLFGSSVVYPRSYYETIYREIYRTPLTMTIPQICDIQYETRRRRNRRNDIVIPNIQRDASIRLMLKRYFNLDIPGDVRREKLCDIVEREWELRENTERILSQQLAREATLVREPIIQQPQSRWVIPESAIFREQRLTYPNTPVMYQDWAQIQQECSPEQLERTPRGLLVFYARRLGLDVAQNETKESLCRKLTRYISAFQGSR